MLHTWRDVTDLVTREWCVAGDGIQDAAIYPRSIAAKGVDGEAVFVVGNVVVTCFFLDVVIEDGAGVPAGFTLRYGEVLRARVGGELHFYFALGVSDGAVQAVAVGV